MVGLIQKTLFDLIESAASASAVAEVKRRAGVPEDKMFRMDEVHDDNEWRRLLAAACEVLNITQEQAEAAFADFACKDFLRRFPMWFKMSKNAREFLERQPAIHNGFATAVRDPEVRKAIGDKFHIEKRDNEIITHYSSPNQLCGLYIALARWIINHYGDEATIEETRCQKKGDAECEVNIHWS
ncbi:MAG TPA: heme NO-binding domain-containing protein [Phycisphaerae bacterium]|nr:heme NO-binding domain-containing protein [Phycisphaerae bacterium]